MKTLLVIAHPRTGSLTHAAARTFIAAAGKHDFEVADLAAEGFDPALPPGDEPDWNDAAKPFTPAVQAEMARIARNAATVMVWPVWWWSMPALMKGWIDRVWNRGFAYGGGARYPHTHVWSVALAGGDAESFARRGYDLAMQTQIGVGILDYCGVAKPRHEVLYGTLDGPGAVSAVLAQAATLGREFGELR